MVNIGERTVAKHVLLQTMDLVKFLQVWTLLRITFQTAYTTTLELIKVVENYLYLLGVGHEA